MKTIRSIAATNVVLALTLLVLRPALFAAPDDHPAQSEVATAERRTAEQKAALAEIDRRIDAIEHSLNRAPDAATASAARTRLDELKTRRNELRKNYVSAKASELSADAKLEYQKAVSWTKGVIANANDSFISARPGPSDTAAAAANPRVGAATEGIELYRLTPSAENKSEVKAALDALEDEIDRLEDHADALPKGPERDALLKRAKALDARKDKLETDFNRARWDAVVADLKSEWERLAK